MRLGIYYEAKAMENTKLSYDEKINHLYNDPYFETRQKEDIFIKNMLTLMENKLKTEFPKFLVSCIASLAVQNSDTPHLKPNTNEESTHISPNVDWDFLGEG